MATTRRSYKKLCHLICFPTPSPALHPCCACFQSLRMTWRTIFIPPEKAIDIIPQDFQTPQQPTPSRHSSAPHTHEHHITQACELWLYLSNPASNDRQISHHDMLHVTNSVLPRPRVLVALARGAPRSRPGELQEGYERSLPFGIRKLAQAHIRLSGVSRSTADRSSRRLWLRGTSPFPACHGPQQRLGLSLLVGCSIYLAVLALVLSLLCRLPPVSCLLAARSVDSCAASQ